MQAVILNLIALLQQVAPGATSSAIATAIDPLIALIPILVEGYKDLLPSVLNIITALKDSGGITEEQWAALDALSAQYDADFQSALAAAKAEDAAASAGST